MKKHLFNVLPLLPALLFLTACEVAPVPIEYHADQCYACKMMIADAPFASELVTTKGKAFKFDAIECLVPEVNVKGEDQFAYILVNDFNNPETFVDAREAWYLVSESRPSPMGGFLSAYADEQSAKEAQTENEGELYNWEALKKIKRYAQRTN